MKRNQRKVHYTLGGESLCGTRATGWLGTKMYTSVTCVECNKRLKRRDQRDG